VQERCGLDRLDVAFEFRDGVDETLAVTGTRPRPSAAELSMAGRNSTDAASAMARIVWKDERLVMAFLSENKKGLVRNRQASPLFLCRAVAEIPQGAAVTCRRALVAHR